MSASDGSAGGSGAGGVMSEEANTSSVTPMYSSHLYRHHCSTLATGFFSVGIHLFPRLAIASTSLGLSFSLLCPDCVLKTAIYGSFFLQLVSHYHATVSLIASPSANRQIVRLCAC